MSAALAVIARPLHPLHAILLAFPIALFTTALAADIAYLATAEMQWSNFAAWAIAGALLFGGPVLLWALVDLVRRRRVARLSDRLTYLLLVIAMMAAGFVNALQHSRDAWSSVGMLGLGLSVLCVLCALAAGWIAHSVRPIEGSVR